MEKEENWIEAYKPRPQPQRFPQNRPYLQNAAGLQCRSSTAPLQRQDSLPSATVPRSASYVPRTAPFQPVPKSVQLSKRLDKPDQAELLSFDSIKEALCSKTVLIHHDGHLPLLIDVDSSVEGGYDAVEVIQEATVNVSIFCN
jgi:hypothetical protein